MATPIEDAQVQLFPLEIASEVVQKQEFDSSLTVHESTIETLTSLLEKGYPSPAMCDFFNQYCRGNPRSQIVIEMFTPAIERILKHNTDFVKYMRMRMLVQEYLLALDSQNADSDVVEDFIKRMHGYTTFCPFLLVLSNFISVCLSGIDEFFQHRKNFHFQDKTNRTVYEEKTDSQLVCYAKILQRISTFYDWRPHLAVVLQLVPFPYLALEHISFMKILKNVVKSFAADTRCEVHRTVLTIRESNKGWLEIFCLGGIFCDDDGETFSLMLSTLISCCCRRKHFLLNINKLISSLLLLASRENQSCIDTLCAMIELNAVENPTHVLEIILTLQSTPSGLEKYANVYERQRALERMRQKGGPRELTLSSRFTDSLLEILLSEGSFGDLECLSLAFTRVTSACAEHLIKLPGLRNLNFWSTRFGDAGLELLSEHLYRLEVLNLCETSITNKGLTYLASMKTLRKLNLTSTNTSLSAIMALKV
ncbi:unnamed protein product [Rotaria socialis]|uniref:C-Maf-inducing protein n=1 Tax=Rotaria socialis TaxID=392032 RepID=A0A818AH06_9BILA|nr:unnamed protein product [Rotaria socialis]CAF3409241.1 unnamed protein product [Rotaria socialis]CAF3503194.1 unnamed protein product [Rotaria socialis]